MLDDYQGVALSIADWSKVNDRANITVFQDYLTDQDAIVNRLAAAVSAEPLKRDNIFSKTRDVREDRGTRETKMSNNDQTNHAR